MNNTVTEMNNTLEEINNRMTETEEGISDLEDRMVKITKAKQNIEKRIKRNENTIRDLWDNIKCTNISHYRGPRRRRERKRKDSGKYLKG